MEYIRHYNTASLEDFVNSDEGVTMMMRGLDLETLKCLKRLGKVKVDSVRDLLEKWHENENNRRPQNKTEFKKSIRILNKIKLDVFWAFRKIYVNFKTDNSDTTIEEALKILNPYWKACVKFIPKVRKRWDKVNPEKRTMKRFIKHFEPSEVRGEKIARSAMNRLYSEWMQPSQVKTNKMRNIDLKNALLKKGVKLNKIMGIYKYHIKQIKDL